MKQHVFKETEENVFLQYYEKLKNATNTNVLQLQYISADHLHSSINFYKLQNVLKLTKNGKTPGKDNI
jgi:hypothetical protein